MAKKRNAPRERPYETRTLAEIVSALSQDVARAQLAADVARTEMQRVYDSHELLRGTDPSRVRLSTVRVTLPLAVDEERTREPLDAGVTERELPNLLVGDVPPDALLRVGAVAVRALRRGDRHRFANPALERDLSAEVRRAGEAEGAPVEVDRDALTALVEEWRRPPREERETRYVYRAADLQQLGADRLTRFEFEIEVN